MTTALEALMNYSQADEDGVMVLVSRQAIHEVAERLEAAINAVDTLPHGDNCYLSYHYDGDPGSVCNCGKESLLAYLRATDSGTGGKK